MTWTLGVVSAPLTVVSSPWLRVKPCFKLIATLRPYLQQHNTRKHHRGSDVIASQLDYPLHESRV